MLFQLGAMPPGDYALYVANATGIFSAPLTVTAHGAFVDFASPMAPVH